MKTLESRFGFHTTPFTRELRIDDRFVLDTFDEATDGLLWAVEQRMSAALIAPAGLGKTTVLRTLQRRLPEARYRTHYVKVTGLSKRDMCREIATASGAEPAGSYPMLVRRLQEHFLAVSDTDGLRPVLILDEAHDLRPDVLSMIRLVTNFEMDSRLVLSVILAGQPPLAALLRNERLEDVARRLSHYASLRPLSREECVRYIDHRCTIAGAHTVPFDNKAKDALYEIGRGNLRATDAIGLKALAIADQRDQDVVDHTHVAEARRLLSP